MANLRPGSTYHVGKITDVTIYLKLALENAKRADSPKLQAAIRRALKSADGARRHAERRAAAEEKRAVA